MGIFYFDQRVWIDLLKGHKKIRSYEKYFELYDKVLEISKKRIHLFPFSVCHIIETQKRKKKKSMSELYEFIFEVSKFISIRPWESILHLEVCNAISKHLNLETVDLHPFVIKYGLGNCFNCNEEISDKTSGKPISKEQFDSLMAEIYQPKKTAQILVDGDYDKHIDTIKKNDEKLAEKLEILRIKEYSHADKKKRKDIDDARFLTQFLKDPILNGVETYTRKKINTKEFLKSVFLNRETCTKFFKNIPSAYVFHELNYQRNNNKSRRIKANDIYDLCALSMAVPYCDFVVTEREWANFLIKKKLDKLYNTIIFSDIMQLNDYL